MWDSCALWWCASSTMRLWRHCASVLVALSRIGLPEEAGDAVRGAKIPSGQDLKAPPTSCAGGLRGGSSSTRGAFRGRQRGLTAWLCPHKRLWELRIYATAGFLTLRNWVRWWICFKLLNFEVICYAAVDKICWQTCRWIGVRWWVNILLKICKNICNTKIYKIWNI